MHTRGSWFCRYSQNQVVVAIVEYEQAWDKHLLHLVCCLCFFVAHLQLEVTVHNILGRDNSMAQDVLAIKCDLVMHMFNFSKSYYLMLRPFLLL